MMMAGTQIDCCISDYANAEFIINVNKSADAQPDYRVMTHVSKTSVNQIMMVATSGQDYVSLALAAPEFVPRKLHVNLDRDTGQDDESFEALN